MDVELVVDAKAALGEGPFWHPRESRLYWVDIEGGTLHVHDPDGEPDVVYDLGCRASAVVARRSGGLVMATESGFQSFDPQTGVRQPIADPESGVPDHRFNDGKCDVRGRFWAGTMCLSKKPDAALYVLGTDGSVRRAIEGVTTSNGLDWSPDRKAMYYIDTPTLQVVAFDFDETAGTLANRRVVVTFPQGVGRPDGMTVDAQGMLWVAHWAGARISRWDPGTGEVLEMVPVPAGNVTSCAFGGPSLDRLYITTARQKLDAEALARHPHSGGLFAVTPGVHGLPAGEYGG
jgi:sugar lactone lactonase YvrE